MTGGTQINCEDGTTKRGDIHILLIGDPGTAKSQLLKATSEIATRSVMTSGKAASAAGLTATAVKQGDNKWSIEAGALVLADGGIACIDELDKMKETDRVAMHEAMESQEVNFSKAGLVMKLRTRCSVLAAANPKYGRFDEGQPYYEQVDLPQSLLSRFDLIFTITDTPDPDSDQAILEHILRPFTSRQDGFCDDADRLLQDYSQPGHKGKYSIEDLRHYIAYARRLKPLLTKEAEEIIKESFNRLRNKYPKSSKILGITFRQAQGYVRLATASAKLRLSNEIQAEDAIRAVSLVECYLGTIAEHSGCETGIDGIMGSVKRQTKDVIVRIKHLYDDLGLTRLSEKKILDELMPELSEREIKTALEAMEDEHDLIHVYKDGCYVIGNKGN